MAGWMESVNEGREEVCPGTELSNASIHVYTHTQCVCVDNNNKTMKMFHVGGLLFFLYIPRRPSNFSLSSASVGTSQKIKSKSNREPPLSVRANAPPPAGALLAAAMMVGGAGPSTGMVSFHPARTKRGASLI